MKKNTFTKNKFGFSLIELLIVISIFTIMTTILVANQRKFGNNIILANLADDVALSIREAQTYGLGSKNTGSDSFNNAYGIYIDKALNNQYILYADTDTSVLGYNTNVSSDGDTFIRKFVFPAGNVIDHFCVVSLIGEKICSTGTGAIDAMSMSFIRPNPDATIISKTGSSVSTTINGKKLVRASICIMSTTGKTKQVEVLTSGQIDVVDTCDVESASY